MIIEGYVIGLLCCLIATRSLDFTQNIDRWTQINSFLTVIVLVLLTSFPILSIRFMLKN